jgi:hypothetical protein
MLSHSHMEVEAVPIAAVKRYSVIAMIWKAPAAID